MLAPTLRDSTRLPELYVDAPKLRTAHTATSSLSQHTEIRTLVMAKDYTDYLAVNVLNEGQIVSS